MQAGFAPRIMSPQRNLRPEVAGAFCVSPL